MNIVNNLRVAVSSYPKKTENPKDSSNQSKRFAIPKTRELKAITLWKYGI